ncbi:hypothetical protein KKB28_10045, partial [bacterium]|nr:hypothetical protein [bacterium]
MNKSPVQEWLNLFCILSFVAALAFLSGCDKKKDEQPPENSLWHPECTKSPHKRTDAHSPETMVSDWGQP